jgi:uncharacterized protein YegL
MMMLSCIFLVTLSNANDIIDVWGKEGASQAFKKYFKEEEWTLNRALVALGSKVPKEALTILRHQGRVGKSMLRSSTALMQHDQDMVNKKKRKGDEWTEAELNRAREILNGMYDTEQAELDVLLVDCNKFLGTLKEQMDENSRVRTVLAENTATARATQLEATKTKKEAEGQLTSLKDEFAIHQGACDKTLAALKANYDLAAFDYNVALKIQNMSRCDDSAKAAAIEAGAFMETGNATHQQGHASSQLVVKSHVKHEQLLECHSRGPSADDDDDNVFFMFPHQSHEMHSKAGRFAMTRMAKMAMMRKMGKHAYHWHAVRQHYGLSLVQDEDEDEEDQDPTTTTAMPGKGEIPSADELTTTPEPVEAPKDLMPPAPKCNVNAVPNCPLLNDAISTMVGELRDVFVKEKTAYETQLAECNKVSAEYEAQIKDWEGIHDQAEVTLAQAITQIDTNQGEMEAKETEYADLKAQFDAKMEDCVVKRNAILDTMCGIKIVRIELYKLAEQEAFFADCEVGDWVPQDCSVSCAGGTQIVTREVLVEANWGADCPPLQMEQECQTQPCPIDCAMDDWSGWSGCSKDCGGGVMSRSRNIEVEPDFKGKECGATTDTQMCNVDACNVPCELADWAEWSECSKACSGGIEVRRKEIMVPALGTGFCADENSEDRFEYRPCLYGGEYIGLPPCPPNLVCDSPIDLMLLLDASGSVGSRGFGKEKTFAEDFVNRFEINPEATEVGVISFSYYITIGTQITDDTAALTSTIEGSEWDAMNTNTAAALGTAIEVLAASGREAAQSIIMVVTDGMPNDAEATAMMAEKVKEKARLIFVPVGKNLDMDALYQWASFPPEYNILEAKGFGKLSKELNKGKYLPDICPNLICREACTEDRCTDYIGCQDKTVGGKTCQVWTETFPHSHGYAKNAAKYKDNLGDHNYCRNPPGSDPSPWCYTTDPSVRWDYCAPRNTTTYVVPEPLLG